MDGVLRKCKRKLNETDNEEFEALREEQSDSKKGESELRQYGSCEAGKKAED